MSAKEIRGSKVIGYNIRESECIWTKSGVVSFKRCENAYDCNSCQFDKAMAAATQSGKKGSEAKPGFREKSKADSFMERRCRHMLTGRVAVKRCPNDFRCDLCEFDQFLEDTDALCPLDAAATADVEGFLYAENHYYHPTHSWARVEYGGRVRIGMDHFALRLLGCPDAWSLPGPGRKLSANEPAFSLEKGIDTARVPAPIEGTVAAVNFHVVENPSLPLSDPYHQGWLLLVEPARLKRDLDALVFGDNGRQWLCTEYQALTRLLSGRGESGEPTTPLSPDEMVKRASGLGWKKLVQMLLKTD